MVRVEVGVRRGYPGYRDLGYHRTLVSLFRHLAAGYQHRDDDRHVSHGLSHSNTQNRDARAINLKLNELIRATEAAGDQMMDIESLSDEELDVMHARYERIRAECMERQQRGKPERERRTPSGHKTRFHDERYEEFDSSHQVETD
jgi:Low affinity iron permease